MKIALNFNIFIFNSTISLNIKKINLSTSTFSFYIQRFSLNVNKINLSTSTFSFQFNVYLSTSTKLRCQLQQSQNDVHNKKIHVNKLGLSGSDLAERDWNKTVSIKGGPWTDGLADYGQVIKRGLSLKLAVKRI